jgi:hypothetical protein
MAAVEQLSPLVGVVRACGVLGVNRARVYRLRRRRCQLAGTPGKRQPRRRPPLALATAEREALLQVLSARTKRSANRVKQALKMAAMSLSHSDSALGAFYRRMSGRMDKPRANTATAHKLARMVYFMLTRGEAYVDQGQQHYEEQQRQRSIAALKRRAAALGFAVMPTPTPA